jgi:hypothetical protein
MAGSALCALRLAISATPVVLIAMLASPTAMIATPVAAEITFSWSPSETTAARRLRGQ